MQPKKKLMLVTIIVQTIETESNFRKKYFSEKYIPFVDIFVKSFIEKGLCKNCR